MNKCILLSVIAISVIFSAAQNTSQACEEGWFGPECNFKCRCQQSCSFEGECPDKCQVGWFGYKCQYRLIQYKAIANQTEEDITDPLTDNNETTCIDIGEQSLILDLNGILYNPWIRLFTQQPDLLYDLKMSYKIGNSKIAAATSKERLIVRDNVVDIHISVDDSFINYIILEGEAIQRLCSVWVLAGQNVATKQNVYYSNSSISHIDTNLPQYPQATDGVYTCDESDTEHAGNYWEIVMNPSFVLKYYVFYVNDTIGLYRYYTVQIFENKGEMFGAYISPKVYSNTAYGIFSSLKTPTKSIIFSVTQWSTNKTLPLLLCEVELNADCIEGTWGVHCADTCNENCPDLCRFDDGLCNNACIGYSDPPNCTNECEKGLWGFNCVNKCDNCVDSSCNRKSGWCDKGCFGYSDPPFCSIACSSGSWGVNCTNECSNSCVGLTCDAKTGFCDRGYIVTTNRTLGVSGSGSCRAHLVLLILSIIIVCALSLDTHYVGVAVSLLLFCSAGWRFSGWSCLSLFFSPVLDLFSKTDNKDIKRNAHSKRNPYTDVFDIHEFRASHQPVSEAEDFAERLQSDGKK